MKKSLLILSIFFIFILSSMSFSQLLLVEDFNYPAGDSLGAHGWTSFSGGATNVLSVSSPGLTFTGYPSSGIGNACRVRNNGQDAFKPFVDSINTGVLYTAFMVKIDSAQSTGDYFLALLPPTSTTFYMSRTYVKDSSGTLAFGISKFATSQGILVYTPAIYSYNTTYILVTKYKFYSGAMDDSVSLFVFPGAVPPTEPTVASLGPIGNTTGNDPTSIGRVALRQGTSSSAPTLTIDGIRETTNWGGVVAILNNRDIAKDFSLKQNYPNPFNPTTKIEFELKNTSFVTLKIFDVLGREVSTLINTQMQAGSHYYNLDAKALSSGVYYYKLEATSLTTKEFFRDSKLMVLIK